MLGSARATSTRTSPRLGNELAASEWHVQDEGFVKARNAYCAKKDGISTKEFVDRHMASVQRVLAVIGLDPGASTRSAYRRYAETGAPLDLVLSYSPTISGERYYDADIGRWLGYMHGGFNVDGRTVGVGMSAITPRPFPEAEDYETTWSVLEKERNLLAARQAESETVTTVAAPTSVRTAAPTIAIATTAALGEEVLYTDEAEEEERPRVIEDYAKLSAEVGQSFMLYTKGKKAMRVEIAGMDEGVLKVRRYLRSGWLEQGIKRNVFERAERVR